MINCNKLEFGYGDIAVGFKRHSSSLIFQNIKPPVKCGSNVNDVDVEYIGDKIIISLNFKSYKNLLKLLTEVENKIQSRFEFEEYIFDFTNYNIESINAIRYCSNEAMKFYLLAMAA